MLTRTDAEPSLSVSIVVYHADREVLQQSLESLRAALSQAIFLKLVHTARIHIVCNDDSEPALRALFRAFSEDAIDLQISTAPGNVGYGAAHNIAFAAAVSAYHLILNPDVMLAEDSLAVGIAYLASNTSIGAVSPCVTDGTGQRQYLCKRYPTVLDFLLRGFAPGAAKQRFAKRLARYEMQDLPEGEPSTGVPIISGCFMLFRSSVLRQIGGFDPSYFLYFEDFDLSLRTSRVSSLAYLPAMKIVHLGGHSARKGLRHILLFARSGMRFYNSWGWRLF